jgi:hypothetical protein
MKYLTRYFPILILFICSCEPGIDKPVTIDGIDFKVISAERKSSVPTHRVYLNEDEELLLVTAEFSDTTAHEKVANWKYNVTDENGRKGELVMSYITIFGNKEEYVFSVLMVISKSSKSFSMSINDKTKINLNSLL